MNIGQQNYNRGYPIPKCLTTGMQFSLKDPRLPWPVQGTNQGCGPTKDVTEVSDRNGPVKCDQPRNGMPWDSQ